MDSKRKIMDALLGKGDFAPSTTGEMSVSGRPLYVGTEYLGFEAGEPYSEFTKTMPIDGTWYTFPSVDGRGLLMSDDQITDYIKKNGPVDPLTGEVFPTFSNEPEASAYGRHRSKTRMR